VFLLGPGSAEGCELIAGGPFSLRIGASGVLDVDFTVPSRGNCFQMQTGGWVRPGTYAIGIGCHACEVAYFRVTTGSPRRPSAFAQPRSSSVGNMMPATPSRTSIAGCFGR
jgi:hypothetical protein